MCIRDSTGTGWPFGGPHVSMTDASTKAIFQSYQVEGGKEITLDLKVDKNIVFASIMQIIL